jgi:hypothetical protein
MFDDLNDNWSGAARWWLRVIGTIAKRSSIL